MDENDSSGSEFIPEKDEYDLSDSEFLGTGYSNIM